MSSSKSSSLPLATCVVIGLAVAGLHYAPMLVSKIDENRVAVGDRVDLIAPDGKPLKGVVYRVNGLTTKVKSDTGESLTLHTSWVADGIVY